MERIPVLLNGMEALGHAGMTILDLARANGVHIPTLCHNEHLAPIGACRLCVVEEVKRGALVASCVTPITAGMEIRTDSPMVMRTRKTIIKLLLSTHPDACPVCDKGNRCELRGIAAELGVGRIEYDRIRRLLPIREMNPFIQRDLSKCIMCGRCIRACLDHEAVGAIEYHERGFDARPAALGDRALDHSECTFCGTCVELCPVGALSESMPEYRAGGGESMFSVCPYGCIGCSLELRVRHNRIVAAYSGGGGTVGGISLCARGRYGLDYISSKERILKPQIRDCGQWQPVSWDQALDRVRAGLGKILDSHGADALGVIGSARLVNEDLYQLQKFARKVLKTPNIDSSARADAAAFHGMRAILGAGGATNPLDHIESSDVILLIGAYPLESHPVLAQKIKKAVRVGGRHLVVASSAPNSLDAFAGTVLRPRPNAFGVLVRSLIKVILQQRMFDHDFVTLNCRRFNEFQAAMEQVSLKEGAERSSVPEDQIARAAIFLTACDRAAIIFGREAFQERDGMRTVIDLCHLSLLTGNIGNIGAGLYPLFEGANTIGAWEMGAVAEFGPGAEAVERPGLDAMGMLRASAEGQLRGLLLAGPGALDWMPGKREAANALGNLEFLVVQDMFWTDAARSADVVLPLADLLEGSGVMKNVDRRIQRVRKAVEPAGEAETVSAAVTAIAAGWEGDMGPDDPEKILSEIARSCPGYEDISLAGLDKEPISRPCRNAETACVPKLFSNDFPVRGFEFMPPVSAETESPEPSDERPFLALEREFPFECAGDNVSRHSRRLTKAGRAGGAAIHPEDADKYGVTHGPARVINAAGDEVMLELRLDPSIARGLLVQDRTNGGNSIRRLMAFESDAATGVPILGAVRVRIEKG